MTRIVWNPADFPPEDRYAAAEQFLRRRSRAVQRWSNRHGPMRDYLMAMCTSCGSPRIDLGLDHFTERYNPRHLESVLQAESTLRSRAEGRPCDFPACSSSTVRIVNSVQLESNNEEWRQEKARRRARRSLHGGVKMPFGIHPDNWNSSTRRAYGIGPRRLLQ